MEIAFRLSVWGCLVRNAGISNPHVIVFTRRVLHNGRDEKINRTYSAK